MPYTLIAHFGRSLFPSVKSSEDERKTGNHFHQSPEVDYTVMEFHRVRYKP